MTGSSTFTHIVGTEIEHRVYDLTGGVTPSVLRAKLEKLSWPYGVWSLGAHRGTNGCRAYFDAASIIEYAGPECTNGTDAMYYEIAGSLFWARMASLCERSLGNDAQAWVIKANTSAHGVSSGGHHTNISMPMVADSYKVNFFASVRQLKALVATLQLISGSGVVLPREAADTRLGTPEYGYAISARGSHVSRDAGPAFSTSEQGGKPLFLERNEPLADSAQFWRLQICGLDSNILPAAIQLKLDILLIMAEMAAMDAIDPIKLIEDPALGHSARRVSLDWRTPLETADHGTLTALEIQWHYYHEAEEYVLGHREGRGIDILEQWADILIAFDTDEDVPAALNGKVDWVTKALMLQRLAVKSDRPLTCDAAEHLHLKYHAYQFNASGSCLPVLLAQRYGSPDLAQHVLHAMRVAPSDTRACARGAFAALRLPDSRIDWEYVQALETPRFKMPDPSIPTTKEFRQFRRHLRKAA